MAVSVDAGLPATVNLTAYRGDTWAQTFRLMRGTDPIDLDDFDIAAVCRTNGGTRYDMSVLADDPTSGRVTIGLPPKTESGEYRYDVQLTDVGGVVTTWICGRINVKGDVAA